MYYLDPANSKCLELKIKTKTGELVEIWITLEPGEEKVNLVLDVIF